MTKVRTHDAFRKLVEDTPPADVSRAATTLHGMAERMISSLNPQEREVLDSRMLLPDKHLRAKEWAKQRVESLRRAKEQAETIPTVDRLRVARELAGLTRKRVAKLAQWDPSLVATIEAGETKATPDQLNVLAEIYDVPVAWLNGEKAPEWLHLLLMFRMEHEYKRVS